MENSVLAHVLDDWATWSKRPEKDVRRKLLDECVLSPDIITVIQGVRRCGKSTLLGQLMTTAGIDEAHAVFINFEDPRLLGHLDADLLEQVYQQCAGSQEACLTFFLDEIQNVSGWQKWLNTKLEMKSGHRFVVTGSNPDFS